MNKLILKGTVLAACLTTVSLAGAQDIRVTVNGDPVNFRGADPMSMNGRVYVPLRGVFEQMGAMVDWDPASRTVTAHRDRSDVQLRIGDRDATVDGKIIMMDAPAQIMHGRTMVPLRFLSESLGANVEWVSNIRTVRIDTGSVITSSRRSEPPIRNVISIDSGTVIPVKLDQQLSSRTSQRGDQFWATVRDDGSSYAGLPEGTRIQGRVVTAREKQNNQPGLLELQFTKVVLPDGRTTSIDGSLIGLDNSSVMRDSNGVYTARSNKKDDRIVYAGYGAGAGLLVGLLTKRPLEGALLGGVLGYLYGEVQRQNQQAADVTLPVGTQFGVRLDQDLNIRG
jgi:hypothetical protein